MYIIALHPLTIKNIYIFSSGFIMEHFLLGRSVPRTSLLCGCTNTNDGVGAEQRCGSGVGKGAAWVPID